MDMAKLLTNLGIILSGSWFYESWKVRIDLGRIKWPPAENNYSEETLKWFSRNGFWR